mgnify:CR=1 FL=1
MTEAAKPSATEPLALARSQILAPAGLDESRISRTLALVMGHAVDAADLYFQLSHEESWAMEDGIVKEGSSSIEQGVGVRALAGERTGFAWSSTAMHLSSTATRRCASLSPPARATLP